MLKFIEICAIVRYASKFQSNDKYTEEQIKKAMRYTVQKMLHDELTKSFQS